MIAKSYTSKWARSVHLCPQLSSLARPKSKKASTQDRKGADGCPRPVAFQCVGFGTAVPLTGSIQPSGLSVVAGRQIALPSNTVCPPMTRRTITSCPPLGALSIGRQLVIAQPQSSNFGNGKNRQDLKSKPQVRAMACCLRQAFGGSSELAPQGGNAGPRAIWIFPFSVSLF